MLIFQNFETMLRLLENLPYEDKQALKRAAFRVFMAYSFPLEGEPIIHKN